MDMSLIKSTGNKSTEQKFTAALRRAGIKGWSVQPDWIEGRPDVAFVDGKVAVFLDGCFWHGCEQHFRAPKINRTHWLRKIQGNRRRDTRNIYRLTRDGWKVFHVWEHDIADDGTLKGIIQRVARAADTPDEMEYDPPSLASWGGYPKLMHCSECNRGAIHFLVDLTGAGVFHRTECSRCGRLARRIRGIEIGEVA